MELWIRVINKEVDLIVAELVRDGYGQVDISYADWQGFAPYCGVDDKSAKSLVLEFKETGFKKIFPVI